MEIAELFELLRSFEREEVDYVLVGGAALNVHGIVRATEDVDLFIRPTRDNVGRLRRALMAVYDDPQIAEIDEDDLLGDYPAVRYYPPTGDLFLDIMTKLGEAFAFEDLEVVVQEIQGVPVRVASPETLYRMKRDTVRSLDRRDAEMLRDRFDLRGPEA